MSPELGPMRPDEVVRALQKAGFVARRQTGSHLVLYKEGLRRPVTVPMHTRELPPGTQRAIIRQAGLTVAEFLQLLQE